MSYILNVLKKLESEKKKCDRSIDLKDTLLKDEFISDLKQKKHKFSPVFVAAMASLLTMALTVALISYFFYPTDNPILPNKQAALLKQNNALSSPPVQPVLSQELDTIKSESKQLGVKKAEIIAKDDRRVGMTLATVRDAEKKEKPKNKKSQETAARRAKTIEQKTSYKKEEKTIAEQAQITEPEKAGPKQSIQEIQEQLPLKWRWDSPTKDSKKGSYNLAAKKEDTPSDRDENTIYATASITSMSDSSVSSVDEDDYKDMGGSETLISNWKGNASDIAEPDEPKKKEEPEDDVAAKDPAADLEPMPSLRIRGAIFISDGSRANYVVLDYNGQSYKLKEGNSADELTLVKIYSNKAMFRFKNRAFYRQF